MANHIYTKKHLEDLLEPTIGKTLGEVDTKYVFNRTKTNPKITGIAGDVVEQSILGYPPDTKQSADLLVDGVATELKTTGLKRTKNGHYHFEAKEPMSITAVSPNQIINEEFLTSKFWDKVDHTLFVYYLYDSLATVPAADYANFYIQGYQFHDFDEDDKTVLKNDWTIVRDFIKNVDPDKKDEEYPKISKLRNQLMYLDTAPKWPHHPRFRLKRSVVTTIVQQHFGEKFEPLSAGKDFSSYAELDTQLHELTTKYAGKTVTEIANSLGVPIVRNSKGKVSKSIVEKIVTRMFGAGTDKLREIDIFAKLGIIPKTIIHTKKGGRTEDTKFDTIDFKEWTDKTIKFEDSTIYNFFAEQTILAIIFQETGPKTPLENTIFRGFKRLQFDDAFLNEVVKPVWDRVRELIWNDDLKVSIMKDKNGNIQMTPTTGLPKEETNFPKASESAIFLRGTSVNATKKPLVLNGQRMYNQQFWLKGLTIVDMLRSIPFI